MKKLNLILLAICNAFIGYAQPQAFSNISLENINEREIISFTIPHEVNVRHYRIEASNDSINFDVITTIASSKGNTTLPLSYHYDLSGYAYKYYRIGMVRMNAIMPYSPIVTIKENIPPSRSKTKARQVISAFDALAH